ncbi:MAG: methyltransferase [SAR324 cluster bacterium]|nr:methyltransferase [SAR324 cluster bacterium]
METTFTVKIEQYAPPGRGMGYHEDNAVFVPCACVGDELEVEMVKEGKGYIEAKIVNVITAGPDRIEPACMHFNFCGGCDLLHLSYENQIKLKTAMLAETLKGYGLELTPEVTPSPEIWHSRHRASLRAAAGKLGMNGRWSSQLVEIKDCKSLSKLIIDKIPDLKALKDIEASYPIIASHSGQTLAGKRIIKKKEQEIQGLAHAVHEDYGYGKLELLAAGFAQSNPLVTKIILDDINGNISPAKLAVEYYAGSGTITTAVASKCEQIQGFELSVSAVKAANRNATNLKLENITVTKGDAKNGQIAIATDLLIVDPPRAGIDRPLLKELKRRKPTEIAYMSCNPATFSRDLADLLDFGYQVKFIKGYDMYPHSYHLECLAVLAYPKG